MLRPISNDRITLDADDGVLIHHAPAVDLSEVGIDAGAAALVPERMCRRHGLLPIGFEDDRLVVAMSDPNNVLAIDDVRTLTGHAVKIVRAPFEEIVGAINGLTRAEASWATLVAEAEEGSDDHDRTMLLEAADEGPIIKLVNLLIGRAVAARASDIHVEPEKRQVRVRYRIDGVLHEVMTLPKSVQAGICSRIKLMTDMDIAERRLPQDGRTEATALGETVDLRAATLPTMFGEKIVIRILRKSTALMDLRTLGLSEYNFDRLQRALTRTHGMILVTGPTGSGKTTSLYAALHALNEVAKNIITVEDPIEYHLPGAYQVQVNAKAGLTFSSALRAILRSDPDTVLVGEVRDHETARLAIDAALTGHLVLSSLHTNDAPSAMTRLTEMGVEPYLVASAVSCVIGQRLIRVLCDRCKEERQIEDETADELGVSRETIVAKAAGCGHCSGTGYHGRTAVHELMIVDETIERLTADRAHSDRVVSAAREAGMRSMYADAREKVLGKVTSVEEVGRSLGAPSETFLAKDLQAQVLPPAFDVSRRRS